MHIPQAISANFLSNVFSGGFWLVAEKVASLLCLCILLDASSRDISANFLTTSFCKRSLGVSSGGRNSSLILKSKYALEQFSQTFATLSWTPAFGSFQREHNVVIACAASSDLVHLYSGGAQKGGLDIWPGQKMSRLNVMVPQLSQKIWRYWTPRPMTKALSIHAPSNM